MTNWTSDQFEMRLGRTVTMRYSFPAGSTLKHQVISCV